MKKESMGMIIAAKRKELGMTQLELAEKMGVTDKAVSKWERDLSFPDVTSLPRLAEIFGMSVDELMQVKQASREEEAEKTAGDIAFLSFKAVCLAMGIAVTVLSILGQLDARTAAIMLGTGLACAGIALLEKK